MWLYIVIAVVVILLILVLSTYNSLVKLNNIVKEAFSTMDVYLKKRWDLIPNLVETVKGYAKHETETLEKIVTLRNSKYDNMTDDEKLKTNNELTTGITKIMALAESYPDLKASDNFKELSKELSKVEDDIANARKYYNGAVRKYNDKVMTFPNNVLAPIFGFKAKTSFEISEQERKNVEVKF